MKDFESHWGYSYGQLLQMNRDKFCLFFGERFRELSYHQFRMAIKRQTPHMTSNEIKEIELNRWKADRLINISERIDMRLSMGWDEVNIVI